MSSSDLRRENELLSLKVKELTAQNASLQTQFEKALAVSDKFDALTAGSSDTSVAELRRENETLQKKLVVLNDSITRLKSELAQNPSPQQLSATDTSLSELRRQLLELEQESQSTRFENQGLKSDLTLLLSAGSICFGEKLETARALAELLRKGKPRQERKAKTKPKGEVASFSHFSEETDLRVKKLTDKIQLLTDQAEHLRSSNSDLSHEKDLLAAEILQLRSRVRGDGGDGNELLRQDVLRLTRELNDLRIQLSNSTSKNTALKHQIRDLVATVQLLKKKSSGLKQKQRESELLKTRLSDDSRNAQIGAEQWERRSIELTQQVDHLGRQIQAHRIDIERLKTELAESSFEVRSRDELLATKAREISTLHTLLDQQKALTESCQERERTREESLNQLRDKLDQCERELEIARRPFDPSQLIPLATWVCSEFPTELQTMVQNIADSASLQLPTKLRHVMSVVGRWFSARTARIEEELAEERTSLLSLTAQVEGLVQSLSRTFPEFEFTSDQILTDSLVRAGIEAQVAKLREEVLRLTRTKKEMDDFVIELLFLLHAEQLSDAPDAVRRLQERLNRLQAKHKSDRKENQEKEKALRWKDKQREETKRLNDSMVADLETKIRELEASVTALRKEGGEIREASDATARENERQIDHYSQLCSELQSSLEGETEERKRLEILVADSNGALREATDQIAVKSEEVENLTSSVQSLTSSIQDLKYRNRERLKSERASAQSRIDDVIQQFAAKNESYLEVIRDLKSQIASLEAKVSELESVNSEWKLKLQKSELRAAAAVTESDRDRKSRESRLKASALAAEAEFRQKLEDCQWQADLSKRELIDALANAFQSVCIADSFDAANLAQTIRNLGRMLGNLADEDRTLRTLLGLAPTDSVQDAVAKLAPARGSRKTG